MSKEERLLAVLREAGDSFLTHTDWAQRAGVSPSEVLAHIGELQTLGYHIEQRPHLGYRLVSSADALLADDLKSRLKTRVIGKQILVFQETGSTNDIVEKLALGGAPEGLVVFAESQTLGRGRMGRKWVSPKGKGLWFSVMLRPLFPPTAVTRLTILASVAVARAVSELGRLDARIKWPNDVLVSGRKVAGILTEMLGDANAVKHAIIGVGVNVRCAEEEFPPEVCLTATSVEREANHAVSRAELAARILSLMDEFYIKAHGNFDKIIDEWAGLSSTLGKRVSVTMGERRIEGQTLALDGDGALLVRQDNGRIERIVGGDLVLERIQD